MQFVDKNIFDENFMDEVVAIVARKLARKIIDQKGNLNRPSPERLEREAKKVVKNVLRSSQTVLSSSSSTFSGPPPNGGGFLLVCPATVKLNSHRLTANNR